MGPQGRNHYMLPISRRGMKHTYFLVEKITKHNMLLVFINNIQ